MLNFFSIFFLFSLVIGTPCDNKVIPDGKFPYSQRQGDSRCEGTIKKNHSSPKIEIVSLNYGKVFYELSPKSILEISSNSSGTNTDFLVKGISFNIESELAYQLDLGMTPNGIVKIPISEVILPLAISPEKLGIYGYRFDQGKMLYKPVAATQRDTLRSESAKYRNPIFLKLMSNADLKSIEWGTSQEYDSRFSQYQLLNNNVNKNTHIEIKIPKEIAKSGRFCVYIRAKMHSGEDIYEMIPIEI